MKILFFSDIHWSKNASLVSTRGDEFSTRLAGLLNSVNWLNKLALDEGCEMMICNGDFFESTQIDDEEATALTKIKWNNLPTYFLCGNHESSVESLKFNLLGLLKVKNAKVIISSTLLEIDNCQFHFIPYITEANRKTLSEYLAKKDKIKKQIIVSHNEIAGMNYGSFISKTGFEIPEINKACDLFLNGHLHNTEWVTDKILNIGSLSAHNFTNNSLKYSYGVWILDTDTLKITFYENPYAFNFYKLEIIEKKDLDILDKLKNNAVITIKCNEDYIKDLEAKLKVVSPKILNSRIIITKNVSLDNITADISSLTVDHIKKFCECCKEKIENTAILDMELGEICR